MALSMTDKAAVALVAVDTSALETIFASLAPPNVPSLKPKFSKLVLPAVPEATVKTASDFSFTVDT